LVRREIECQKLTLLQVEKIAPGETRTLEPRFESKGRSAPEPKDARLLGFACRSLANRPLLTGLCRIIFITMEGMAMFVIPAASPHPHFHAPIETTASFGARLWSNCGSVSMFSIVIFRDAAPRLTLIVQNDAKEAVEQLLLDLGRFPLYAAQQHLENGKNQRPVQFERAIAVRGPQSK
jgi:hypothetical protein